MKVAFRADASLTQGTGHVVRSLTLAREFQKCGHDVRLISSIQGLQWLNKMVDISAIELETCQPHSLDTSSFSSDELDFLVVDSYEIPVGLIQDASRHIETMAIVDKETRGLVPSLLLDQNLGAEKYSLGIEVHQMIGPSFALVRQEIRDIRRTSSNRIQANSKPVVMVIIGGADHDHVATLIGKLLSELDHEFEIHFVTPSENQKKISIYLPMNSQNVHPLTPDIHSLLPNVDVVISAAGTSTLDLSCIGIPTVYIAVVENQFENLLAISHLDIGFALGRFDEISNKKELLHEQIYSCTYDEAVREKFFHNAQNLVDGFGASRVVSQVEEFLLSKPC